jgi:hypothetical protein
MEEDGVEVTTIYHDEAPEGHKWSVVSYWNVPRYRAFRIDNFETLPDARFYLEAVEPTTPRISFGGQTSPVPISREDHRKWKRENNLQDYDIDTVHPRSSPDAKRQENFYSQR